MREIGNYETRISPVLDSQGVDMGRYVLEEQIATVRRRDALIGKGLMVAKLGLSAEPELDANKKLIKRTQTLTLMARNIINALISGDLK